MKRSPLAVRRDPSARISISCLIGLLIGGWAWLPLSAVPPSCLAQDARSPASVLLHEESPADVDVDPMRLADAVESVRQGIERNELRGAVLLVARRGQTVLHEALGYADFDEQREMRRDSIFHVASNTKPAVAALAAKLAHLGVIDLDAPIGKYLPKFDRDSYREVTLRRLLSHTSGLRIGPIFLEPLSTRSDALPDGPTLQSEVDRFADQPVAVAPGTSYAYNNPGYNIVGAALERATRQPLEQLLQEHLYAPLDMRDTQHVDRPGYTERRAAIATRANGQWKRTWKPGDPAKYPFVRASGGMLTTAADYATFLQMFLNQGEYNGRTVLHAATVREAVRAVTRDVYSTAELPKQPFLYGLGWQIAADGVCFHGGSDGTYAWFDPEHELLGVFFTQSPGGVLPFESFRKQVTAACATNERWHATVVAHRGLLREFPENTLVNFRECLERKLGFEFDVRRTRDGQLVCLHDATLARTAGNSANVADLTLSEIKQLDAGTWFDKRFAATRVPTVDEVFALAARYGASRSFIAVDLKQEDERVEADVVALAKKHQVLNRLVMIGRTIDQPAVRQRLKQADAKVQVARLAANPEELDAVFADTQADWAYLRFVPSVESVRRLHAAGKRVLVAGPLFATKQPEQWRRAAVRGVDAILTDFADDLATQLRDDSFQQEHLRRTLAPFTAPPAEFREQYGEYKSPLIRTDGTRVEKAADWPARRREIHDDWTRLLGGPWPALLESPTVKIVATEKRGSITQHQVEVEVLPGKRFATGHLLIPAGTGPFPAALVTFYESRTSVGLADKGRGTHDYGWQLAQRGFVTLSIGTPGSLELPAADTRQLLAETGQRYDRQPLAALAYAAANSQRALAQMPEVDASRIGVIGLSYGGKWSMFASCLHEPFAAAVWSDPGIVFDETNGNVNYFEPWYLGFEKGVTRPAGVPNADRPRTGLYRRLYEARRDLHELHALMAPRPVLVSGGTEDPPRNWRALNHLWDLSKMLGADDHVSMTARPTHIPTPQALEQELQFLELHLKYR